MSLLDVLNSPWAIDPGVLEQIQAIYTAHLRGEHADIAAIEARLGRTLANEQKAYSIEPGGVGLLKAQGIMAPRANMFTQVSGGVSTRMLASQLAAMEADPQVKSALLAVDSPGGNVLGVPAAVDALRSLSAAKPTVTVGEGQMASAMYWLASASNNVFIEGETDMVGSLGVVMRLGWDKPKDNQVELVRGKYKRASVDGKAPSDHILAQANEQLDYLYGLLIDAVAQNRGVSASTVLDKMADGRVFVGRQAVDAGLVDGFSTVDAMLARLATNPSEFAGRTRKATSPSPTPHRSTAIMPTTPIAAAPAAPRKPSSAEMIEQAKAHATKHGGTWIQAYQTLGFDAVDMRAPIRGRYRSAEPEDAATYAASAEAVNAIFAEKQAVVGKAKRYAIEHRVSFVQALSALGVE